MSKNQKPMILYSCERYKRKKCKSEYPCMFMVPEWCKPKNEDQRASGPCGKGKFEKVPTVEMKV